MHSLIKNEIPSDAIDLPPPNTQRWVTRRKAVVVNAVCSGVISLEEVCRRYELSVEEFVGWQRAIETHGVPGLRVTRLQIYRDRGLCRRAKPRHAGASVGWQHQRMIGEAQLCAFASTPNPRHTAPSQVNSSGEHPRAA
jgi:hypothetical protein